MSFMTLPKVYNILKNDFHPLKINIFSTYTPPPPNSPFRFEHNS